MAIRDGLASCSNCGSKDTHRGLYGFKMDLDPQFGKITDPGVTKWVCKDCGNEDTDSTIKEGGYDRRKINQEIRSFCEEIYEE